ncbi:TsaA-like domain-containing protein [Chytriomyces cf. hyalinus JEL632]|nr:TsaA-like domain-containing protein [Chytriomyces cf. hyalinus JEL632]
MKLGKIVKAASLVAVGAIAAEVIRWMASETGACVKGEEARGDVVSPAPVEHERTKKRNKRDKKEAKNKDINKESEGTKEVNAVADGDSDVHSHCKQRIYAERAGRIAAEKAIREDVVRIISDTKVGFPSLVIGNVQSAFVSKRGTPRQGLLVAGSRGVLQFSSELPVEAFEGLDAYSHVFVLFIFHDNTNLPKLLLRSAENAAAKSVQSESDSLADASATAAADPLSTRSSTLSTSKFNKQVPLFAAKVFPPLLRGGNTGVFATRSPHHPNPFGQSLVKIESVDPLKRRVYVSGLDMMDGTPILDIKPWNPADCPVCLHAIVDHGKRMGQPWLSTDPSCKDAADSNDTEAKDRHHAHFGALGEPCGGGFGTRVPAWVEAGISDPYELPVEYTQESVRALESLVDAGKLKYYASGEADTVRSVLKSILSLDIRSFHQGRGKKSKSPKNEKDVAEDTAKRDERGQDYEVDYDTLNVAFTVKQDEERGPFVLVKKIVLASEISTASQ